MSGFREPEIPRQQIQLWSQRLEDLLAADHPVRVFDELFDLPQFARVVNEIAGRHRLTDGRPPFHPRYLILLYVYGMLHRLRSSRQLERACMNNIEVIWLMHGQRPDHSTIAAFLAEHTQDIKSLLRASAAIGMEVGLIDLRNVAVDGTKIEAAAGVGSVRSEETIKKKEAELEKTIAEMEAEFGRADQQESLAFADAASGPSGEGGGGSRLAAAKEKLGRMRRAQENLQRRRDETPPECDPPRAIGSTTDPDSRVMVDKEGRSKPNYNAQAAVDGKAGMVVGAEVNDQTNDLGQLSPMLGEIKDTTGRHPEGVLADAGYNTGRDLKAVEETGIMALVDAKKEKAQTPEAKEAVQAVRAGRTLTLPQLGSLPKARGLFAREAFAYHPTDDTYTCPGGWTLTPSLPYNRHDRVGAVERKRYRTGACGTCPHARLCCQNPKRGRDITRGEFEKYQEQMKERMASDENKERYKLRGQTVEPRIGTLKSVLGLRKFMRRGLENVRAEFRLGCLTLNVGILLRWLVARAKPLNPAAG